MVKSSANSNLKGTARPSWAWPSLGALASAILIIVILLPFLALGYIALSTPGGAFKLIFSRPILSSSWITLLLIIFVGFFTCLIGVVTAWILTIYEFPGSKWLSWALLLPLAMPGYISAYSYVELLDYSGPLQTTIRNLYGYQSIKDYWFPSITTLPGAIFILSFVLYPYIYIAARSTFLTQSIGTFDAARTLGAAPRRAFFKIALPLARPAIIAGLSLAIMETLNDIGVVEYFGVETLTVKVYNTWLERANLAGAAQISMIMLIFIFMLILFEQSLRAKARFHQTSKRYRPREAIKLKKGKALIAFLICFLPVLIGFLIPLAQIIANSFDHFYDNLTPAFFSAAKNSLMLALLTCVIVTILSFLIIFFKNKSRSPTMLIASRLAGMGYALPGTVLAVGVLIPLTSFDTVFAPLTNSIFGKGLLLTGSIFALLYAYCVRFMGISLGAIDAGVHSLSPNLAPAAQSLGAGSPRLMKEIYIPLLKSAMGAGALMIFVDCMKELSATLLLRPFNFETLATYIYQLADLAEFNEASLAALLVVFIGLIPLLLLHKTLLTGRPGHGS